MLNISEIFLSIQGESTFSGLPCIFIRLTGCNLRCSYCDTTYSYKPYKDIAITEILREIEKYHPVKLVEITGGEPLLQKNVISLMEQLHKKGFRILLETNGSILADKVPQYVHKIMDIKCPGSNQEDKFCIENLSHLDSERDEIKFVLSDRFDYQWSKEKITSYHLQNYKILFSTVFTELKPKILAEWIVEDRLDVRLQLQLHKYIWNPEERGV